MLNPYDILRLYTNALINEVHCHRVEAEDIRRGIREMSEVYKPNKANWTQKKSRSANYNDVGHRCAYLHKYAALHTAMVQELLGKVLHESDDVYDAMMFAGENGLKICSLGGGPGTDAIGVLSAVHQVFGLQTTSVQIVDLMPEWEYTLEAILNELVHGDYGSLSRNLCPDYFNYSYKSADLLGTLRNDVNRAIASADLVTMVKFVSAAACVDTAVMVRNIFTFMKPGALVLFIDNAAGGFSELVYRLAQECNLFPVFRPLAHLRYSNPIFNIERYGYVSCSETTVTVHILMKPLQNLNIMPTRLYYNQNMDIPNGQLVAAVSSIDDTKSNSKEIPPLQPNNQQSSLLPPAGFKIENSQLGNIPYKISTIGNHSGTIESIPATDYQSSFCFSLESTGFPSEAVEHRISTSDVTSEKCSSVKSTDIINNYGTLKSNTQLPSNNEFHNSKEFDAIKKGLVEVLVDVSKDSNGILDVNTSFKQPISKDIKSYQTSVLPKSKHLKMPSAGDVTQNVLIEKIISSDKKENINPSEASSLHQATDLITRDNTKNKHSLTKEESNSDKKGCFPRIKSIIGCILCCSFDG